MNMNVDMHALMQTLQLMGQGMLGIFVVIVLIYLVVLAAIAWLAKSGKLSRILPPKADKLPVYAACGLSGLALLAAFLGTGVSYYAMWALAAVVFALAVYYTVKQL